MQIKSTRLWQLACLSVVMLCAAVSFFDWSDEGQAQSFEKQNWQIGLEISPLPIDLSRATRRKRRQIGLGSYLVNAACQCGSCHTYNVETGSPYLPGGNPFVGEPERIDVSQFLTGGHPLQIPGTDEIVLSRNIRPDENGLPAGLTEAEFVTLMKTGLDVKAGGTRLLQMMWWPEMRKMSQSDIRAIYMYLKRTPPVQ